DGQRERLAAGDGGLVWLDGNREATDAAVNHRFRQQLPVQARKGLATLLKSVEVTRLDPLRHPVPAQNEIGSQVAVESSAGPVVVNFKLVTIDVVPLQTVVALILVTADQNVVAVHFEGDGYGVTGMSWQGV